MKQEEVLGSVPQRLQPSMSQRLRGRVCQKPRETSPTFTLFSVLAVVAVVVVITSARINESPDTEARNLTPRAAVVVQPGFQDEVRIKLTSSGFVPGEAQHAAGTFAIAVENATLTGEYTLQLKAEDGTVLKEVHVQKGSSAWSITLQAGQYTLTETQNPQWLWRLTVQ